MSDYLIDEKSGIGAGVGHSPTSFGAAGQSPALIEGVEPDKILELKKELHIFADAIDIAIEGAHEAILNYEEMNALSRSAIDECEKALLTAMASLREARDTCESRLKAAIGAESTRLVLWLLESGNKYSEALKIFSLLERYNQIKKYKDGEMSV
jgi:hypothetical protein